MRSIKFMSPVDWMRGSLNGRPNLTYDGEEAYSVPVGQEVSADDYKPIMVAKVLHAPFTNRKRYYQVRTRSKVNMTARMRQNLALMGGVGAIFSSLLRQKSSEIYAAVVAACPKNTSLRQFVTPLLRAGLEDKSATIIIADGVAINNPWIEGGSGSTVTISQEIINKFMAVLGSGDSPYSAEATAALQAAFTNEQWIKIRDYGFEHREIVGYMNAYAPEDAKIADSLVPTLGIKRWIRNTSAGPYIDTGVMPSPVQYGFDIGFKLSSYTIIGNQYYDFMIYGNRMYYVGSDKALPKIVVDGNEHRAVMNYVNGVFNIDIDNGSTDSVTKNISPKKNVLLWANDMNGNIGDKGVGGYVYAKIYNANALVRELYPFIRNGVNGMIDVLSDTFYPNAGSGSFTITEENITN